MVTIGICMIVASLALVVGVIIGIQIGSEDEE